MLAPPKLHVSLEANPAPLRVCAFCRTREGFLACLNGLFVCGHCISDLRDQERDARLSQQHVADGAAVVAGELIEAGERGRTWSFG